MARCTEDFNQAISNDPVFSVLQLPDGETERAWVVRVPVVGAGFLSFGARIAAAHATRVRAKRSDGEWSRFSQFPHDFRAGDFDLARVNVP